MRVCARKRSKCGAQFYKKMATVLPEAKEWTTYPQINDLFDQLAVPLFSRKGNLPRLLLVGLLDHVVATQPQRYAPLMREMRRGHLDLFNLALGHVSRSYLVWTYACLLVKQPAPTAAPLAAEPTNLQQAKLTVAALEAQLERARQVMARFSLASPVSTSATFDESSPPATCDSGSEFDTPSISRQPLSPLDPRRRLSLNSE